MNSLFSLSVALGYRVPMGKESQATKVNKATGQKISYWGLSDGHTMVVRWQGKQLESFEDVPAPLAIAIQQHPLDGDPKDHVSLDAEKPVTDKPSKATLMAAASSPGEVYSAHVA